jgi:hypothetical protein
LLYVPEIEPRGVVFFFWQNRPAGQSLSMRRYESFDEAPTRHPDLRGTKDLDRWTGDQIVAMATHAAEVSGHDRMDAAEWRRRTLQAEAEFGVVASVPDLVAPAAPVEGLFFSARGRPLRLLEDWRQQHPVSNWKRGYSAMSMALVWRDADGVPATLRAALQETPLAAFEMRRGVVEHKTQVPGEGFPSVTDLMVFGSVGDVDVILGVEGKVDESFGPLVRDWSRGAGPNKRLRLAGLCDGLDLSVDAVQGLRYQLLHRTWSALATARDAGATHAVLCIHSLQGRRPTGGNWRDYVRFVQAMGVGLHGPGPVEVGTRMGVRLWVVWVTEPA